MPFSGSKRLTCLYLVNFQPDSKLLPHRNFLDPLLHAITKISQLSAYYTQNKLGNNMTLHCTLKLACFCQPVSALRLHWKNMTRRQNAFSQAVS